MPDYSEEQIAAANKFLSKITQYREKYENDHEKIWRTNKKEIVQEFLQDCDGIKPLYKYFLFEERGLTSKYPFYPFILLGWALLIVLPGLLVKQAIIPEDFEKFFLADLATTLAFVLVGTYLVFAIRNVESQVIRVVSLELYDRIPEKEYINYILDIREKLYTKNFFSFTFFAITGLAIFTLVVIHGMAHVIFFKEIGFWNSFYHYVGLYPELAEVNEQGFLITPLSFFTKLMFEIGWVILIITMVGLAFYVFH
ncbi:MAG: hypothetical protein ACFFC6_14045, partial [Promethearchaeota archaeon]